MLVLSRGANDKVVFPTLDISVEILRVAGNKVRLGIEAPKNVPVHRHEVVERDRQSGTPPKPRGDGGLSHSVRNRLNAASLGLHLLQRKLELGQAGAAEADVFAVLNELKSIESELQGRRASAKPTAESAPGHRALVVEDDANERELLSGYLSMSGFSVDTAVDGMQAMVKLTRDERPDVVLLDMKMPRFDGRETIAAIRNHPDYKGLKVIAVSGGEPRALNVAIGADGVDRWCSKPINPQDLVAAIHEELGAPRATT